MDSEEARLKHREKLMFLMVAGAIGIMLLIVGGYQLVQFTDSVAFCGRLCHTVMYPEFTAYSASPHSRVLCYSCHVGSGADYLVRSKVSGVPFIFSTIFGTYDRPIPTPVANLRPARETCEECHRPERFTGDLVRVRTTFLTDEQNTRQVDSRVFRVGGGEAAVASGIHWHIAAQVSYLALDKQRNEIAWVGAELGGYSSEYVDPAKAQEITPERVEKEKRLMDCIDCHNHVTHIFQSPSDLMDTAIVQGNIDSALPFIKKIVTDSLYPPNPSLEAANARRINSLLPLPS